MVSLNTSTQPSMCGNKELGAIVFEDEVKWEKEGFEVNDQIWAFRSPASDQLTEILSS